SSPTSYCQIGANYKIKGPQMAHDTRILKDEDRICEFQKQVPEWIRQLQRPPTPAIAPKFGPLEGVRAVGTGVFVAQPYIGTKLAEFGAEVELALAVNPSLVIVKVSTYGQYGAEDYLTRAGYDAVAQAYGGMMHVTGDPGGPPQRAKVFTGDYLTALTGWAATMMALWEVKKTGRGQVVDVAQFEAVAQTQGNCMPFYTGQGTTYGHTGNRAPGFQPYDTFSCKDGWVFIAAIGGAIYARVPKFLGLDPELFGFEACSKDAAAVNSERGRELDRRLREYCAARTCHEVETELNKARIGCSRIFSAHEQHADDHYNAREMTVPVLDRQSGVPIRVYGVVPKLSLTPGRIWRGSPSVGEDTTGILSKLLGFTDPDIARLYEEKAVHRTEP